MVPQVESENSKNKTIFIVFLAYSFPDQEYIFREQCENSIGRKID
jgi:hypothetical protein